LDEAIALQQANDESGRQPVAEVSLSMFFEDSQVKGRLLQSDFDLILDH
jgi:hypothetical protein